MKLKQTYSTYNIYIENILYFWLHVNIMPATLEIKSLNEVNYKLV